MSYTFEFEDAVQDLPMYFLLQYQHYLDTTVKPHSIKLIEGVQKAIKEKIHNTTLNDIYYQAFISTATGTNLDKHGEEIGVRRNVGESDTDFRNRLIGYNVITRKGNTIEAVIEFIESLGYTVDTWEKTYYDAFYADESGVDDNSYAGIAGAVDEKFKNYIIFIFLTPTPDLTNIQFLEGLMENIKKVYNKILIR